MKETLDKHIGKNFDTSNTADKVNGKLLSTNASMAPIAASIQQSTNEAVFAERVATKMEKPLKLQTVEAETEHVRQKVGVIAMFYALDTKMFCIRQGRWH